MGQKLLPQPWNVDNRRTYYFNTDGIDDFDYFTNGQQWTQALTNSAAPTISSSLQDGVLIQLNTAAINDASFLYTTKPAFLWATNVTHVAEILFQFSEASVNNANVWFGFTSLNTVNQLVGSNGGVATNFTGAGIYKTGGQAAWQTVSSQGTTQNKNTSGNFLTAGQAGYQRLRVQIEIVQGVAEITYFIDQGQGMLSVKDNTSRLNVIKDFITLSSPAAMYFGFGIKNGAAVAETLNTDYAGAWKLRSNFVASA